ncbi:DUF2130 domain-containing protein [Aestuariivirga sp.]|uniref:DUF2130 domain-containing protein n=1 Tax=Aestuariivirga sp. TaxID=2650926 RepID=UPI0039E5985A
MMDPTIICPSCRSEIKLTESLAAPLIAATRQEFEKRLIAKDADFAGKLAAERQSIEKLAAETAKKQTAAAMEQKDKELAGIQQLLTEREHKLAEAQKAQADYLKKQGELDDQRRELDLTVEKKIAEGINEARETAKRDAEEGLKLKLAERDEKISGMQRQIEELRRKAEQGSQQLQGEVLELELEQALRGRFAADLVEPVGKGEFGGDIIHRVVGSLGQPCGAILWESKRTKNWAEGWLAKLRADQRAANAEIAVLVSAARPKDLTAFDQIDGIWVVEPRLAVPLAVALRSALIELAAARQAQNGQHTKMELVYGYLTGPKFRHRVEAILEQFDTMRDDLNSERKAMMRLWAKREAQISAVLDTTAGLYGDLQGIVGKDIRDIEGMDLPLIASGTTPP